MRVTKFEGRNSVGRCFLYRTSGVLTANVRLADDRFGQRFRAHRGQFITGKNFQGNLGQGEGTSTDRPF